ncbi:hypothetical protein ACWGOT_13620 [[Kitasatospora] papulosa]
MPSPDRADRGRQNPEDGHEVAVPPDQGPGESRSDVFLDVPALHVDELNLEVDDLEAHVSLQAEVLDLLKLNVGADVRLGRVELDIEGVDVQAQLRVRLHNIAAIVTRLLSTVDRNPQILEQLTRGVGEAVENVGAGAGTAVKGIGEGAGEAVEDVGRSGARAVEGADDAVGEITGDVVGSTRDDEGSGTAKKADSGRKPRAGGAPASKDEAPAKKSRAKKAPARKAAAGKASARKAAPARKAAADAGAAAKPAAKKAAGVARRSGGKVTGGAAGRRRHPA